jgi:hypothetical protein
VQANFRVFRTKTAVSREILSRRKLSRVAPRTTARDVARNVEIFKNAISLGKIAIFCSWQELFARVRLRARRAHAT